MGKRSRLKRVNRESGVEAIAPRPAGEHFIWPILRKAAPAVAIACVLLAGITLRHNNLRTVQSRSPDEQIYTYQGVTVLREGANAIRSLIKEYNVKKEMWLYPPPVRISYTYLLVAVMKAAGATDEMPGSYISFVSSIAALMLLVVIGLRFFNAWITAYALLFLAVSPLDLAIARRAWQDSLLGLLGLLLIYCCCEITRNTKNIAWYIVLVLTGSYCVLIKENGALMFAMCLAWVFLVLFFRDKAFLKGATLLFATAVAVAASVYCLVRLAGGLQPVIDAFKHTNEIKPLNRYINEYQNSPWYGVLQGFWLTSPVNAVLCAAGMAGFFFAPKSPGGAPFLSDAKARQAVMGIMLYTLAYLLVMILTPYCQNMRIVSLLYAPFYLVAGLGLWYIVSAAGKALGGYGLRAVAAVVIVAALWIAVSDYRNFERMFVMTGARDLSAKMVVECSRAFR